jgi:hypothetical protein
VLLRATGSGAAIAGKHCCKRRSTLLPAVDDGATTGGRGGAPSAHGSYGVAAGGGLWFCKEPTRVLSTVAGAARRRRGCEYRLNMSFATTVVGFRLIRDVKMHL